MGNKTPAQRFADLVNGMSQEEVQAFAKRINEVTPETIRLLNQIAALQARLALYALLEEPGIHGCRGKYWDLEKEEYMQGWLICDDPDIVIASGPTLEDALRAAQQKRKA